MIELITRIKFSKELSEALVNDNSLVTRVSIIKNHLQEQEPDDVMIGHTRGYGEIDNVTSITTIREFESLDDLEDYIFEKENK